MNNICIAYLAGIWEGEGYIKSYQYPRLMPSGNTCINKGITAAIAMTDKDVMLKVAALMSDFLGVSLKLRGPLKNGTSIKPIYELRLYSDKAYAFIVAIYDYMGIRRKKAIRDAIKIYSTTSIRKSKIY